MLRQPRLPCCQRIHPSQGKRTHSLQTPLGFPWTAVAFSACMSPRAAEKREIQQLSDPGVGFYFLGVYALLVIEMNPVGEDSR